MPWTKVKGRWVRSYGPNKKRTSWNRAHLYLKKRKAPKRRRAYGNSGSRVSKVPRTISVQLGRRVPTSLPVKLKYTGQMIIQPSKAAARVPAGFFLNCSSLNPMVWTHFGHNLGGGEPVKGTFAQVWPTNIAGDALTCPKQSEVLGARQLAQFYHHYYVDSSKITYRIRFKPGQQPSKSSIDDTESWYNDFYCGLTSDDANITELTKFSQIRAMPLKRTQLVTQSSGNNKFLRVGQSYNPRKQLSIKDPSDCSQLKVQFSPVNTDNTIQNRCTEETYFALTYFPSFSPEGGDISGSPPMGIFYCDYSIEYNIKCFEPTITASQLHNPLIFKKW